MSSHHPHEVLLVQFSLYVHKSGLKPDSFNLICSVIMFFGSLVIERVNADIYCVTKAQTIILACLDSTLLVMVSMESILYDIAHSKE